MDWIERFLDVYPDNGDGSLELLVLVLLFTAAAVLGISTRPSIRRAILKTLTQALRWPPRKRT